MLFAYYCTHSLVPRPLPSFPSLAVQLSGKGPGTFSHVSDVTSRKTVERLIERGRAQLKCCCESSLSWLGKTLSSRLSHEEQHKSAFMHCHISTWNSHALVHLCEWSCLWFTWCPCSHNLPCPWHHSHEKMYQALSCLTVLQTTESWVRAWKWGYCSHTLSVYTCSSTTRKWTTNSLIATCTLCVLTITLSNMQILLLTTVSEMVPLPGERSGSDAHLCVVSQSGYAFA